MRTPHTKPALAAIAAAVLCTTAAADDIYLIGNSLTWDTQPELLDGNVQHHIDCNKNLQYIHDHPALSCVPSSTDWTVSLANTQYDWLSVQPFVETTLAQDIAVISTWMQMQPGATVVLHTGWSPHVDHEATYHDGIQTDDFVYAPEYFEALRGELLLRHPGRTIVSTDLIGIVDSIYHDVEHGVGPYGELAELYRDPVHFSYADGRFLAHNAMRRTLGQPFSTAGFETVPQDRRTYLLAKIVDCPADVLPDQMIDVFDLLTYLDQWFAGAAFAERTGDDLVDVFDLLLFIDHWFAGS